MHDLKGVPMTYFAYFKLAFIHSFFFPFLALPFYLLLSSRTKLEDTTPILDIRFIMYCARIHRSVFLHRVNGYLDEHWHLFVACKSCGKQIRWEGI